MKPADRIREFVAAEEPKSGMHANDVRDRCFVRGDHVELGKALVEELGDVVHDELHPWTYDETSGLWTKIESSRESRIVQGFAGLPVGERAKPLKIDSKDVAGAIKLAHDQIAKPGFFADVRAIAFADCVVRLTDAGLEVLPHAREHRVGAGYSFRYTPNAKPARFIGFLSEVFRDDADREEKTSLTQEFFGACIFGVATKYQRALLAYGPKAENGKSTLSDAMISCMPQGTTSAIAPQDWGQEYRRAMLVGKHLNAVNELPEREIIASESFKAIVTGDPIVGRVIRESPVMFRPMAGHYFAANKLPGTSDQTDGFWRRFVMMTFNRSFKGDPSRDPDMSAKLIEERPLIVSWLLDGAARLVKAKGYTIPASHHEAMAAWRKNADQVALFVDAEVRLLRAIERASDGMYATEMYAAYRRWAESNGHRSVASNTFGVRMRELGHEPKKTKTGWRYPMTPLTAAERATGDRGDGLVTDCPSPETQEVAEV